MFWQRVSIRPRKFVAALVLASAMTIGAQSPAFAGGAAPGGAGLTIADAICMLNWLFAAGEQCGDDYNGDGAENLGDVVYLLDYLFRDGPAPVDD